MSFQTGLGEALSRRSQQGIRVRSFEAGLGRVLVERNQQGRRAAEALLKRAAKVGKLMKERESRLCCFGVRRFEEKQVVLGGNHLFWTDKPLSGIGDFTWVDQTTVQTMFSGHVSLAVADCQVAAVQDSTRFMIEGACEQATRRRVSIVFDAGSQECRDEWVNRLAAQVERCQASAFQRIPSEEVAEPCAICLSAEVTQQGMCRTHCCHHFCKGCLEQWLEKNKTCPCCRQAII